jgi:putative restriction endonuclease
MKEGQSLWTRNELILAINLYCKLPFGKLDRNTKEVKELALIIGRTANSVALKLVNFSSLDPSLQSRGIKGMGNASKLDKEIWNEFYNDWDVALIESEKLLAKEKHTTIEKLNKVDLDDLPKEGKEKERLVKVRVNQCIFRTIMLATYNNSCCITGISNTELLIASHIVPWSKDEKNRLNPMNGLCLNALHDKAFDCGLITISAKDLRFHRN